MALRASKPSFNVREKLTELAVKFGLKGSELAKAETVQDARDIIGAGRRNLCINGNFKCWQRGTSIAGGATGNSSNTYKYVTADRWQTYFYNSYARQDVVLPNGEKVYALRETFNVTRNFFAHIIEDGGRIWNQGGDITISFWARTSGKTTGVSLGFYWYDDWAGSAYTHDAPRENIIIEGSEWKHYSVTKKLSTNANNRANLAIEFDNNNYGSWSQLTSGEYWEFANIQIEKGSVATDFEHRSIGEELALCQRYYQKIYYNTSDYPFGYCYTYNQSASACTVPLPTNMRGEASSIDVVNCNIRGSNQDGVNNGYTVTSFTYATDNGITKGLCQLNIAHNITNSSNIGAASVLTNGVSNVTSYIAIDAEL